MREYTKWLKLKPREGVTSPLHNRITKCIGRSCLGLNQPIYNWTFASLRWKSLHMKREREQEFLKSDSNFSLILWTATPYGTWGNVPEKSVNLPILGCNEDGMHGCMHPKLQDKIIVNDKSTLSCTNNEQKQRRFSRTHTYQTTRQNIQC